MTTEALGVLERLAAAAPDAVLSTSSERGETTVRVHPGRIADVCLALRDELDFEHLSDLTAVDLLPLGEEPRFRVVYHLLCRSRRERLRVVAPLPEHPGALPSVAGVYPTANWHEREVHDMFGIRFEGHPGLARILLPDEWETHPLRKDEPLGEEQIAFSFNQDRVRRFEPSDRWLRQAVRPAGAAPAPQDPPLPPGLELADDGEDDGTMTVNMGPQHPSTHGVLRLVLELDGETVVECEPVIGYLHTGFEKTFEDRTYNQAVTLTDRMDYLSPLINNLGFALAVERIMGVEVPPRARVARVLLSELTRISSHLVWLGTQALDLGALSVFLYCFRERERILDLFEAASGARMMTSYIRPFGLAEDLPAGWTDSCRDLMRVMPSRIDEYESLLTRNELFRERTEGVGVLPPERAVALGVTGPPLRASGVDWDLRRDMPYSGYEEYDFRVPVGSRGDVYERYVVRMAEMRESVRIVEQALDRLPPGPYVVEDRKLRPPTRAEMATGMEAVIHHFKLYTEGYRVGPGEAYVCVESPRGELGYYVVADGGGKPYRVHVRGPSFVHLQALPEMARGGMIADLVASIGSLDPVLGEVDR
jgi:NADH dehydrogenase I D subunit